MMDKPQALTIDIGGTKIKAGLIDVDGGLRSLKRLTTPAQSPPEHIIGQIIDLAREICAENHLSIHDLRGIGISVAAFISAQGRVVASAHLSREWIGFDLGTPLREIFDTEFYFALDAPAPALGEAYYGAGKGLEHFVYVTVSTGIGAGMILGGQYYIGGLGWAGGVGHTIIDETSPRICHGCGNAGCLETFAATQGIIATAQELVRENPDSLILPLAGGDPAAITPEIVFSAAQEHDPTAGRVWELAGHALGIGLMNLVNIVSPTRIVVGGGISQAGDLLLEPARRVIRERAFPPPHRQAEVVQSALRDLSGIYGAAAMVFNDLRINPILENPS